MKIVCEKEKLLKGINSVVRGVPTRTTMPILEGILIQTNDNELKLTSYDLELGIEYTMECEVQEEGNTVVNSVMFSEIIRKLPDTDISIEFSTTIFGSSGNSSGFIVDNLYKEPSHSITKRFFSSKEILIWASGNLLIISLNIIALTTVAPWSFTSQFIMYSIPISKSYVVNFTSLSFVWINIPSNIGIVVLVATAFVTELSALIIFSFSQIIFILTSPLLLINKYI